MKTLLKNGNIIDGSGKPAFSGSVLIEDDKIISVSEKISVKADKVIDCKGLIIAPGFIDAHSHNDFFYDYENSGMFYRPFVEQGITTQITGNCGFSVFGIAKDSKYTDKVGGGLFHAVKPGSFKEFISRAEGRLYLNMVPLIGHGTTRISVSGYEPKPLNLEEINAEMELVAEAMENGAFGGSFGFMYEPGIYSKKDELIAFARKLAEYGGILTVHPRACSKVALGYPLISRPHIELALEEVSEIMKECGVQTEYSHLIFVGKTSWKSIDPMLKMFHKLKDEGYNIGYDLYSFTYGASVITVVLPPWYMALTPDEKKKPFNLFKLRLMTNITKKALGVDFSDFTVAYISPEGKRYEGKTVDVIAKEEGMPVMETYLKLVEESKGQGRLYLGKYYSEEIIERLMRDDMSVFMTDAWVEEAGTQNGAAYQSFPYFLVKAKTYGIPLEQAVHKMTGKTALRYGIEGRGIIKEGNYADITVFDPATLKVKPEIPNYKPEGINYVFINGNLAVNQGEFAGNTAGRVILKKR